VRKITNRRRGYTNTRDTTMNAIMSATFPGFCWNPFCFFISLSPSGSLSVSLCHCLNLFVYVHAHSQVCGLVLGARTSSRSILHVFKHIPGYRGDETPLHWQRRRALAHRWTGVAQRFSSPSSATDRTAVGAEIVRYSKTSPRPRSSSAPDRWSP
jgi:hypothetical protein